MPSTFRATLELSTFSRLRFARKRSDKHSQFNDASSRQVFLPIFASLADVFGRHSSMQFALCCFLVGSALSTGAQNMAMMLAGRAIAGVGAAGLITVRFKQCSITVPNSRLMKTPCSIWQLIRTILADTRSLRAQNIQATCLFVLYGLGFSTGPVIGGSLSKLSLRWIFGIKYVVMFILKSILLKMGYPVFPFVRQAWCSSSCSFDTGSRNRAHGSYNALSRNRPYPTRLFCRSSLV